jgi:hypothetical protein
VPVAAGVRFLVHAVHASLGLVGVRSEVLNGEVVVVAVMFGGGRVARGEEAREVAWKPGKGNRGVGEGLS